MKMTVLQARVLPIGRGIGWHVADRGEILSYADFAHEINLADGSRHYTAHNLGPLLELMYRDCEERGEPRLTSLVINQATGRPSYGYTDDPVQRREQRPRSAAEIADDQQACWDWAKLRR